MSILTQYQTDLEKVNTAITRLLEGKAVTELQIGAGAALRRYKYTDIKLETLRDLREELLQKIRDLSGDTIVFKPSVTIPLVVVKGFK